MSLAAIASALLDQFQQADGNSDGMLSIGEARSVVAGLSEGQFDEIDGNHDLSISRSELEAILNTDTGCTCSGKSRTLREVRRSAGDMFLFGAVLLAMGWAWPSL